MTEWQEVRLLNKIFGLDEAADDYLTTAHAKLEVRRANMAAHARAPRCPFCNPVSPPAASPHPLPPWFSPPIGGAS